MKRALTLSAIAALVGGSSITSAMPQSTRGPFYIQGAPLSVNYWGGGDFNCGRFGLNCGAWRPDVEFGIHFTGRHDGFVLAFRQALIVTAPSTDLGGATVMKFGYSIPIPIKKFELNIQPYGTLGVGYDFGLGGRIGVQAGFLGADVKFFIAKGFYAFARPFELGMQCFHDSGRGCGFQFIAGAGVGYAFPDPGG